MNKISSVKVSIICLVSLTVVFIAGCTVTETAPAEAVRPAAFDRERADAANIARWDAVGEHYAAASGQNNSVNADVARWIAMGDFYINAAKSGSNRSAGDTLAVYYTGKAVQQFALTGDEGYLPTCLSPEMWQPLNATELGALAAQVPICLR